MLRPDYYYESVFVIPYQELREKNIRCLIFDVDNTLAPYHVARPPAKITALIRRLQRMGFTLCLLTNNTEKRMRLFNEHINVVNVHGAMKPFTRGIKKAMREMSASPAETAIIGDQLFSDVWGGKNARLTTILVQPISKKDIITVKMKRGLENFLLRAYLKDNGGPDA